MMTWLHHAERLADGVTYRGSQWYDPIAETPRHVFVPYWWDRTAAGWTRRAGRDDEQTWMSLAYSDESIVTQIGDLHADRARPDEHPVGRPTSSSTHPCLVVRMLDHAHIRAGDDVLDVATGSGYSAAVLSKRLGDEHVTSIDVDKYLTDAAADRLASLDLYPHVLPVDATGPIPGTYDRIVSMVSTPGVPESWLKALRPGGRLVTVLADTALILTADRVDDGGDWAAIGRIERDWAMFMSTRHGPNYEPTVSDALAEAARTEAGDESTGPYPVINLGDAWELMSLMAVTAPGVEHSYTETAGSRRVATLTHPDGSWARAEASGDGLPIVHQGGPRRLWDILDGLRAEWLRTGYFQLFGAMALVAHDGTILLTRGDWRAVIRP